MNGTENIQNALTGHDSGVISKMLDASEFDFLKEYQEYVQDCIEAGKSAEQIPEFSDYVDKAMQRLSVPTELGKRIRLERKKIGLSAQRFSELCGITRNTLSAIENCKRPPTLQSLIQIADVLGISLDELLGRTVNTEQRDKILAFWSELERKKHPEHIRQALEKRLFRECEPAKS